jgi:hypothetical protein
MTQTIKVSDRIPIYPTRSELHAAIIAGATDSQIVEAINRNNEVNAWETVRESYRAG